MVIIKKISTLLILSLFLLCLFPINVVAGTKTIKNVTLDKQNMIINIGETEILIATIEPQNARNKTLKWTSDNIKIATVNTYGTITGVDVGIATITVTTSNGLKDTCLVTVINPIPVPESESELPTIYYDGFEGSLASFWRKEIETSYGVNLSTNYQKEGSYSARFELKKTDYTNYGTSRSEILIPPEMPLEEHWYSFSTYLPNGGDEDYAIDTRSEEIITQWHGFPDLTLGEDYICPVMALLTAPDGHYHLDRLWDDATVSTNKSITDKGYTKTYDLGSYVTDKGKWVDWKFHVKWGWLGSQNPILEVYKNGVKILDCTGLPNTTNDQRGVYMKIGVYKWDYASNPTPSTVDRRVIYFDNFLVQ